MSDLGTVGKAATAATTAAANAAVAAASGCLNLPALSGSPINVERALEAIRSALTDELLGIFLCVIVVVLAICVLLYAAMSITTVWQEWRRSLPSVANADIRKVTGRNNDDVVPRRPQGAAALAELPGRPEAAAVAARMARVTGLYSSYNKAMQRDAARRGELADDLIDRSILSRGSDNYSYYRRRQDRLRFRSDNDQREWVNTTSVTRHS